MPKKRNQISNEGWHSRFEMSSSVSSLPYLSISRGINGSVSAKWKVRLLNK